jgi:DNA-binding transcriptional ArsR family regulator
MTFTLNEKMIQLAAQRFRMLGEPMRLRILQVLETGDRAVHEIVNLLGASQSNISKHLRALCHAGLVNSRREGLNIYYGVADPMVFKLCRLVCASAEHQARLQLAQLRAAPATHPRRIGGRR